MSKLVNFLKDNTNDNLFSICSFLLKTLGVKYSAMQLNIFLNDHLNPLSLLAVRDTLSAYGIKSVALRKGEHSYHDFELPFICSIQQADWPGSAFTVVTNIHYNRIDYLDPLTKKIIPTTLERFESVDKGMVMLMDSSNATDEVDLKANLVKERNETLLANLPLAVVLISLLSYTSYLLTHDVSCPGWVQLSYLLTTGIGVLISLLLIWHDFDQDNRLINRVCGKGGKKVNCNAVLSSAYSSVFGISWSIWGVAYFGMLFLMQLLFVNNFSFLVVTASVSFLAVPYVGYSVYVQWQTIKHWCPLCLGIQSLLMINALIAITVFSQSTNKYKFSAVQGYAFIVTLLIGAMLFYFISVIVPVLKSARDSITLERNLRMFKSDKKVFKYFLNKSKPLKYPADNLGIVIGNPAANNELIKVCNPYCSYCSDMHLKLELLIKNNHDISIRIIFTVPLDQNDIGRKVVTHFLAIQQKYGNELVHTALNDWYGSSHKDNNAFARRFVVGSELEEQEDRVRVMKDWVDSMKIRVTPTLFFNGHEFPPEYKVDDLIDVLKNNS